MNKFKGLLVLGLLLIVPLASQAQEQASAIFVAVADSVVTGFGNTSGAAWVDYDHDGDLDMFTVGNSRRHLFRNDNNTLVEVGDSLLTTDIGIAPLGVAWADYDEDGDLDVLVAGVPTRLYANDGGGTFTRVTGGALDLDNRGWSPSWADADNDGDLDFFITHPAGFVSGGPRTSNHLVLNDGSPNYTFTKVTTLAPTQQQAPFTIGNWSDFDDDGDLDLFVGSGPANGTRARDFFYRNLLVENGALAFERITDNAFANDRRDGQTPNFADIDNDGDLDFFITNWGGPLGGIVNDLYRNENGEFVKIADSGIVDDRDVSLANLWGDLDLDGDLDVYVTNGRQGASQNRLYLNNGDGTFVAVREGPAVQDNIINWGGSLGDYDNDGDLDLFVSGQQGRHRLYRNETGAGNGWLKLQLVGQASNRTAVGAKVFATATINGAMVTQQREVSTQNSFLGHNSLTVHFGLGDASEVTTVRIQWPSGQVDEYANVGINQTLIATENVGLLPLE